MEESGSDDEDGGGEEGAEAKSKKKRKLEARLKIADLKQACPRPEVVEVWDVTAQDPKLLVYLKASSHQGWLTCHGRKTDLRGESFAFHSSKVHNARMKI